MLATKWTSWIGFTADEVSSLTLLPLVTARLHQPSKRVAVPGARGVGDVRPGRTRPRVLQTSIRSPSAMPRARRVVGMDEHRAAARRGSR